MANDATFGRTADPGGCERPSPDVHVLVAEDDMEMRRLLAFALRERGYRVTECEDGFQLSAQLRFFSKPCCPGGFSLIVSDIRMPWVTGLEALRQMSDFGGYPPVILITAFGDRETHAYAERMGAAAVFDKPFEIEDLMAKVEELVSLHECCD